MRPSIIFIRIGNLFSYFYTYSVSINLKKVQNLIYTGWWKRRFGKLDGILENNVEILGPENIYIGHNSYIRQGTILCTCTNFNGDTFNPRLIIGNNVLLGRNCHISACLDMSIGDNTVLSDRVTIVDNVHGDFNGKHLTYNNGSDVPDVMLQNMYDRKLGIKGPVFIGSNVYVGEGVVVLSGVTIGDNSVIGNNCIITKSIPPYSIVTAQNNVSMVTFEE